MTPRVGLVADASAEGVAAQAWLQEVVEVQARRYEPGHLEAALNESDVVWIHGAARPGRVPADAVRGFLGQGGGLLLTLQAAALVGPLGLEAAPPNDCRELTWSDMADEWWSEEGRAQSEWPHVRGLAAYGPHPLVEGLHDGTLCWSPTEGESFAWACYSGGAWPADGRVIAVERGCRVQNPERIVAWEYAAGRGLVLCLGAYAYLAAPDRCRRPQLERLLRNALRTVGAPAEPRTWWPSPGAVASASDALALPEPLELDGALPAPASDALAIANAVRADEPFDLAGRRLMLLGGERHGIREVWVHPHRAVASWVVRADGEAAEGVQVEVTPDLVARAIQTGGRRLHETAFAALEHPVALVEYRPGRKRRESVGRGPLDFEIELVVDLRRTWPFAAACGGNLVYRGRSDGRVVVVASESDDGVVALFLSRAAVVDLAPAEGAGPAVRCRLRTTLGSPLLLAVVGGADHDELQRTLRGVRRLGVGGLVRQRAERAVVVAQARSSFRSDDPLCDQAFGWAKRRLDAFLGDVPGVGRSLLAGYAMSGTAGKGGDGRPGRAWFVGPDACWAGAALLAAGEFSAVRQVIRFLGDRQDVTGEVAHEATTSGQFHFDAAEATPLYLLLVARYLAWSGDRDFVASVWPHVERALAWCLATDHDGDGLMEQRCPAGRRAPARDAGGAVAAGHAVSLALAAQWHAALRGMARAAEVLGHARVAADCWARAARVTAAVEDRFYDAGRGAYALELRADGPVFSPPALQSLPLALGSANLVRAEAFFDALAGDAVAFATPVGRGWAALAEYRAGRGAAAFRHLRANVDLAFTRQWGAFDEALDADVDGAAEGCPDCAASAAMVVLSLVEGLLGAEPDAADRKLVLAPQIPEAWSRLEVQGLRCGDSAYDLSFRRGGSVLAIQVRRTLGTGLALTVAPFLDVLPVRVEVDGREVRPEVTGWRTGLRCAVTLPDADEHEVRFSLK